MKDTVIRFLIAVILLLTTNAMADVDVENEEAESFTLSAYARMRFSEFGGALTIPDRSFGIESAGITADFEIDDNLEGQLQLETTPEAIFIKDCYLRWEYSSIVGLQAGRFKKPFCLNTLTSTWDLQAIDHSITHRELSDLLYSGRDIGAVFILDKDLTGFLELSLGIFNGAPGWLNQDNELQYVARAEFELPYDITLGTGLSTLRFGEEDFQSTEGYIASARQSALGGDLEFETDLSNEFSLLLRGEFLKGDNWAEADVIEGETAPEFQTWWATTGISWETDKPFIKSITASFSLASWKPDTDTDRREDEMTFTVTLDTGTPLTLRAAAISCRPHNVPFEDDRTDFILEAALNL